MQAEKRVVVVGAGHSGVEAALASARLGADTVLVTLSMATVARMPCNPAVGGQAKGHLVREIDALGGEMARVTDETSIQFKYLNTRKGLAARSSRAQVDRHLYPRRMLERLRAQPGLRIVQGEVVRFVIEGGVVRGVVLADGSEVRAGAVVVTAGTFLAGQTHRGRSRRSGGGNGEEAAGALARLSEELELGGRRMKTGTVPRLDGRTIHWDALEKQQGDEPFGRIAHDHPCPLLPRIRCSITHTNERTHEIIRASLSLSPVYNGEIEGPGPRYCPSIEDKVVRFPDRTRHQVFLEPEGLWTYEVYPNGISTSLPVEVQERFVHSIVGLEDAVIVRPGYAIEYDAIDPRHLDHRLAVRACPGLFFAGQVNGTTGYEEAAAQGLMAGINAAHLVLEREAVVLARDDAYIGVLIDDLVTRGADEPYRMFTSRAEYRLLLREDNADQRLYPLGHRIGLIDDARWALFVARRSSFEQLRAGLQELRINPSRETQDWLAGLQYEPLNGPMSGWELLRRPGFSAADLVQRFPDLAASDGAVLEMAEIDARYGSYVQRQREQVERDRREGGRTLPSGLCFADVRGLSHEVRERLERVRPDTVGQAGRVPGVTPAAITALLIHLKTHGRAQGFDSPGAPAGQRAP